MAYLSSLRLPLRPALLNAVREDEGDYLLRHPHDRGYKYLLSSKHIFHDLLRSLVRRGWVEDVDAAQLTKIDKSYVLPDFRGKESDIVYRLKLNGQEVVFYVLLELQSTVDAQMPWRLLLYQIEIWRQAIRNMHGAEGAGQFRLPVVIPVVLYNGSAEWTAPLTFRELMDGESQFPGDGLLNFSYVLLDVQRYTADDLEKLANIVGAVLLLDKHTHGNMADIVTQLERLAPTIDALPENRRGMFVVWLEHTMRRLVKPSERSRISNVIRDIHKKGMSPMISHLANNIDEIIDRMEREAIKRGLEKGMEQGLEQGLEQGMHQGKIQAMETVALVLLRKGMDAALIAEATSLSVGDIEQLRRRVEPAT